MVGILVLAGIFDWISGNPPHGVFLFAAATAIAVDGERARVVQPVGETALLDAESARWWTPLVLVASLGYALVAGGFGRYSWPETLAILVPASLGLAAAWRGPLRTHADPPALDRVGVTAWATVFIAGGLWELTSLLLQPSLTTDSYAHPTISVSMDPVLAHHPGRTVVMFLWLVAGWFLVQR